MSYEGTEYQLCQAGHLTWQCCYAEAPSECRVCGTRIVWTHTVDETNGAKASAYPTNFLNVKQDVCCSECGKVKERLYEIPVKAKDATND